MKNVRTDLQRLIDLNYQEQWVPHDEALDQLAVHGDALIPGLILALEDDDYEFRLLAIGLLHEAGPRAEAAVPALVKKISDPDRLVRLAAASTLAPFGQLAVAAVPFLEPWLEDDHEYDRLIAATTILALDPGQSVLLFPKVKEALTSDDLVVRSMAREFFDMTPPPASQKMADKKPTDRVRLTLLLNDVNLWPLEEGRLHELGCSFLVQTSFIATVEVPVGQIEAVAKLPSVREIR